MIQRAIENGDEHVIKFTEVCLREHAKIQIRPTWRRHVTPSPHHKF